jgi:hypothetical protein
MGTPLLWNWTASLAAVGKCLSGDGHVRVLNGGVVVPSTPIVSSSNLGVEKQDDRKATRRPTTGPRPRAPRWQGTPRRPWTASTAAPVVSRALQRRYEAELSAFGEFYPGTQLWHRPDGVWLLCRSRVLDGLPVYALFLVGVSYAWPAVRGWGFWAHELGTPCWMGPRHTNFFDGSICAYEPTDGTWAFGQPIVQLLDLYSVWALRHLHLDVLGTWPGHHVAHYAIERVLEQRDNEYCGCGATTKLYGDCCKTKDLSNTQVADAVQFVWVPRRPSASVLAVVKHGALPPQLSEFVY